MPCGSSPSAPPRRALATAIAVATLAWLAAPTSAQAEMPRVEPILSVATVDGPSQQIRICTGAKGGAYFSTASQMLGLVQAGSGLPVSVTPVATAAPKLREPHTDDMRAMVDDLLVRVPPQRVPAIFMHAGKLICHPQKERELRDRIMRGDQ